MNAGKIAKAILRSLLLLTLPLSVASGEALKDAEEIFSSMTLRQKVGQLFFIRPDSLDKSLTPKQIADSRASGVISLTDEMIDTLREYPVGGFAMFKKNITSPRQLKKYNQALKDACAVTPFISVDEEGGLVARIANHPAFNVQKFESAATVGATGDESAAYAMGEAIGKYLVEYGFNMDFAPVADVFTNPANTVIGTRAFSSDAETVAHMSAAMADGLRASGVIAVFKHFPGHGDTQEDSHVGLAVSNKEKQALETCEWLPFRAAGSNDCVMSAHVAVPNVTGDMTPSTMSADIIEGVLKGELGFEGLVITDALEMGAIANAYTPGEAVLLALSAGCDMLLCPVNLCEAFDAVVAAVESGEYPESRLNDTVLRILRFKETLGLL